MPLIATIVLGLTDFEAVTVSLGVFLIVAAFAISGIRRGLAFNSPWQPMRKADHNQLTPSTLTGSA